MNPTQETLDLIRGALESNDPSLLAKAGWTQPGSATAGLQMYPLEEPSKKLFPVLTPLRNSIPRDTGGKAIQANWKAVTGINTAGLPATVAEGKRGGVVTTTTADYLAAFRGFGLEDTVSFEAEMASKDFEDVRALSASNLLKAVMIEEEALILAGQGSWALGACAAPVGTQGGATGNLTARTVICFAVPLTYDGYRRATASATGLVDTVSVTAAGPYGGSTAINAGHGIISSASGGIVADGTHKTITWNVTAVPGAFGYAWYTGTTNAAGSRIAAITTINQFVQTDDEGGGNQLANTAGLAVDRSQNSLAFDGLVAISAKSGSNAYYKSLNAASLTYDNAGGCVEIDNMLDSFYGYAASGNLRLSPSRIFFNAQDLRKVSKGVLIGSIFKATVETGKSATFQAGGSIATEYLNKVTGDVIKFERHPNLPPGKMFAVTDELPYPLNGVPRLMRMLLRAEYRAYDWPLVSRQYEYGVYGDGVLQHYFPASLGILDNFAA
jgi:hypothetical protein